MRKSIGSILVALSLFLGGPIARAQTENTLLWKVEGNGLKAPSYLFGTIHMLCKNEFELKEKVKGAFGNTEKLVLELNFSDASEMQKMQKMMFSDKTLSSQLTETERTKLDSLLKLNIRMSLQQLDRMSPAALVSLIAMQALSCPPTDIKVYEMELLQMALQKQRPIAGLETIEQQIAVMNRVMTLQKIIEQLEQQGAQDELYSKMVEAYKTENLTQLSALIKDEQLMDAESEQLMLVERNRAWMQQLPILMQAQPTFIAVGAGHLVGEQGLIRLLKNSGFTVSPVY
jgi:uncharacterized protein YbaP (TraB family)